MTNHTIFFSTLLLLADLVVAQEPQEFSSPNEKKDSLSSLSVIPLKSAQASKVLRLVIKQYDKELRKPDLKEFTRAIGLAANGVGIGSFVYLRRIFER